MNAKDIIEKFESQDPHTTLDGVWAILNCTDRDELAALRPYIPVWRKKIKTTNLGGMFYRNSDHFNLAMTYIKQMSEGGCHCFVYQNTTVFSPQTDAKKNFISILNTEIDKEKYETRFDVRCNFCGKPFKVTEVMGWHVPWYKWEST